MRKFLKVINLVAGGAVIVLVILGVAYNMGLLTGNPKGIDTYAYLTKIRLILDHFPNIDWNPYWDSGTPFSIWSYPPAAMVLTSLFVKLFGLTPEFGLTALGAVSFILLGLSIYGLVYKVSKSSLAGILTVLVLVSSPASWSWWNGGNYVRVFGLGMAGMAIFLATSYLESLTLDKWKKSLYVLTVFAFSFALMSHLLLGGVSFALIFLFFLFSNLSWGKKIKEFIKLFLPAFALASYWYLPLFLTGKPVSRFIGRDPAFPINWQNFISPAFGQENFSLSTNVLPFLGLGLVLFTLVLLLKKRKVGRFQRGLVWAWAVAAFFNFLYNSIGHLPFYPETGYIIGFPPITAFSLFGIILVVFSGILVGVAVKGLPKIVSFLILPLAIIVATLGIYKDLPHLRKSVGNVMASGSLQGLNQSVISVKYPRNYRYGTDSAFVADWFNWKYDVYQTRDYFGQGITYLEWQNWFETAVWYWEDNYPETKFLLDWYGVREFFVGDPHFKYGKFLKKPEDFMVANQRTLDWQEGLPFLEIYQFEYPAASPILSARNTPVVLFFGKKEGYDFFFRALALTGLDSQKIIPTRGGERIDKFSDEELSRFDGIIIYEYSYENNSKTISLLENFLKSGKTVIWDTHGDFQEGRELPEFMPLKSVQKQRTSSGWEIQKAQDVKSDNQILWQDKGESLVVSRPVGEGRVVWSGVNLPFLVRSKKSKKEVSFLKELIENEFVKEQDDKINYQAIFVHPERREIEISSASKGVLLKESYVPSWRAKLNGKRAKIYQAGPDLMYIFTPEQKSKKVVFEYKIPVFESVGRLISILALIWLLIYAFESVFFPHGISKKLLSPFTKPFKKIKTWWEDKEE